MEAQLKSTISLLAWLAVVVWLLLFAVIYIWTDHICKGQGFEGGKVTLSLRQTCFSHSHFLNEYHYELYTTDGKFIR